MGSVSPLHGLWVESRREDRPMHRGVVLEVERFWRQKLTDPGPSWMGGVVRYQG